MSFRCRAIVAAMLLFNATMAVHAAAAADDPSITLVVAAGRPLRVRVTERITIKAVGQTVTGIVVDPVYAYDRIVIPAGASVTGRIVALESPSRWSRARTMLAGDFTPRRTPTVRFDTLILDDGKTMPIATAIETGRERLTLSTTTAEKKSGAVDRGKEAVADRTKEAISGVKQRVEAVKQRVAGAITTVKAPGKMQRLKEAAINQLPYHPQYLQAGTLYTADLIEPIAFGEVAAAERFVPDGVPAPASVLTARLVTPLDSAKVSKGAPMQAVVTEPVFSADHMLIFPEGTTLDGEVTFVKRASSLHRNGQLRFLIERVRVPEQASRTLLASLYAIEAKQDDRLVVDDEGGASATNSKTRFIAPALALASLRAATDEHHRRFDNDADDNEPVTGRGNIGGRGVAGWLGFGALGAAVGQISRPVAVALGVWGAARTMYSNVLGKGRDVVFPENTLIQVQLSPVAGASSR
jgi:hypothetical protein